jgi:hypothetical protein
LPIRTDILPIRFSNLLRLRQSTTGHAKQRVEQHTDVEFERPAIIGWVTLGSVGTTVGLGIWGLLMLSVEVADIVPWLCKAWDKLCNFARSNCVADTPGIDADTDDGTGEIELVVRGVGSTPSVRDSIDDRAVEEDNVARTLDIFNGAVDVDV